MVGKRRALLCCRFYPASARAISRRSRSEHYEDEYGKRTQAMIEERLKGHEITAVPEAPERGAKVVDIMAA